MPSLYYVFSFLFVLLGFSGFLVRHGSFVFLFISLEIILLGFGIGFCFAGFWLLNGFGYVMGLVTITITAVEATIGFGLLVTYHNMFQKSTLKHVMEYVK